MDKRFQNNQTLQQRRANIYGRRRKGKGRITPSRLEAAKNVLRRHHSEVYDAGIDDPRFRGMIRVGPRKYTPEEVIDMAASILADEEVRRRELLAQHGLKRK